MPSHPTAPVCAPHQGTQDGLPAQPPDNIACGGLRTRKRPLTDAGPPAAGDQLPARVEVRRDSEGRYVPTVPAPDNRIHPDRYLLHQDEHRTTAYRLGRGGAPVDVASVSAVVWESLHYQPPGPVQRRPETPGCTPLVEPPQGLSGAAAGGAGTSLDNVQRIVQRRPDAERDRECRAWERIHRVVEELGRAADERDAAGRPLDAEACRRAAGRLSMCGMVLSTKQCAAAGCGHHGAPERYECGLWQLCPRCARIRSSARRQDLRRVIAELPRAAGCRWRSVTLPVRTDGELAGALATLSGAMRSIWRDILSWRWAELTDAAGNPLQPTRIRRGRGYYGRERVYEGEPGRWWRRRGRCAGAGAFRAIEFGPLNGNVHAHLLCYSPYVDQRVLSNAWSDLTGSDVVWIQSAERGRGLESALLEATKYLTKVSTVPVPALVDAWEALRGRQSTQLYGTMRGVARPDHLLIEWTCERCGGHHYLWRPVDQELARREHERGPPLQAGYTWVTMGAEAWTGGVSVDHAAFGTAASGQIARAAGRGGTATSGSRRHVD